jgi:mutator protein MutT
LARRSATRRAYAGQWSFPGGHVEASEDFVQALHRELQEEIGVVPTTFEPLEPIVDPHAPATTYWLFAVTAWAGHPTIRDQEHSELRWVPLGTAATLPDLALETYRALFTSLERKYR